MSARVDFITTFTLSATDVDACLATAGLKGNQLFQQFAVTGGQTNTTPPLTKAEMAQVYIMADIADVNEVINADALRSHNFFEVALANAAA